MKFWRAKWGRRIAIVVALLGGLWLAKDKIMMEIFWNDLDSGSAEDIKNDLRLGNTGPAPLRYPCVTNLEHVDLDLRFVGPMPTWSGDDLVMTIYNGPQLIYRGSPKRHLHVLEVPICRKTTGVYDFKESALWALLRIYFTDLANQKSVGFGGEQAFPIYAWKDVEISLHPIPVIKDGTITEIIVRPTDPNAQIPDNILKFLDR